MAASHALGVLSFPVSAREGTKEAQEEAWFLTISTNTQISLLEGQPCTPDLVDILMSITSQNWQHNYSIIMAAIFISVV